MTLNDFILSIYQFLSFFTNFDRNRLHKDLKKLVYVDHMLH